MAVLHGVAVSHVASAAAAGLVVAIFVVLAVVRGPPDCIENPGGKQLSLAPSRRSLLAATARVSRPPPPPPRSLGRLPERGFLGKRRSSRRRLFYETKPKRVCNHGEPMIVAHSYGGVGSTVLLEKLQAQAAQLGLRSNRHDNGDGLKHHLVHDTQRFFAKTGCSAAILVYLWGDPVHSTLSLYRRGFHNLQFENLHPELKHCDYVHASRQPTTDRKSSGGVGSSSNSNDNSNDDDHMVPARL
eukprot:m.29321 g.29321  ORF g.29321 m.29321 type:complete len:243 (+) comp9103_c0_seq1:72-800(+)